jgi:hypothetical protein
MIDLSLCVFIGLSSVWLVGLCRGGACFRFSVNVKLVHGWQTTMIELLIPPPRCSRHCSIGRGGRRRRQGVGWLAGGNVLELVPYIRHAADLFETGCSIWRRAESARDLPEVWREADLLRGILRGIEGQTFPLRKAEIETTCLRFDLTLTLHIVLEP